MTTFNLDGFTNDGPDRILVLDTETTGLEGGPRDAVVDVGICEVVLSTGRVADLYSSIVGYDITGWSEEMCHSWIFENTDLTVEAVAAAKPFQAVKSEVMGVIRGKCLTTYNMQFDLDRFLYREPWGIPSGFFLECDDIMFAAADACRLHQMDERVESAMGFRYPKLDYAYRHILKDEDPAGIRGKQGHRALSDARVASHLMVKMYRDGLYEPMRVDKRRHPAYRS